MMSYITMLFTCEKCGKKLEAHVAKKLGSGIGDRRATCPSCGKVHSFPDPVIEVIEVPEGRKPSQKA